MPASWLVSCYVCSFLRWSSAFHLPSQLTAPTVILRPLRSARLGRIRPKYWFGRAGPPAGQRGQRNNNDPRSKLVRISSGWDSLILLSRKSALRNAGATVLFRPLRTRRPATNTDTSRHTPGSAAIHTSQLFFFHSDREYKGISVGGIMDPAQSA